MVAFGFFNGEEWAKDEQGALNSQQYLPVPCHLWKRQATGNMQLLLQYLSNNKLGIFHAPDPRGKFRRLALRRGCALRWIDRSGPGFMWAGSGPAGESPVDICFGDSGLGRRSAPHA